MNLALLSVSALVLAVVVSCVSRLNVGVLSVALAWIVGVYVGGMSPAAVMGGFPSQLFLTLAGVTLAVRDGAVERDTAAPHPSRRARLPRQHGHDSDHVLRPRRRALVDGAGQHRDGRAARADRDGDGHRAPAFRCS